MQRAMTLYLARYILPINRPPIEDGALFVREGRIGAIGRRKEVEVPAGTTVVDFGDAVLLPPLVNAHTHLELTHFPLWARNLGEIEDSRSFVDWVKKVIRIKRAVDPKQYAYSLDEGIRASMKAGTGAIGDILSWFPARSVYRTAPLFGRAFFETLGRDPERNRRILRTLKKILREGQAGQLELGVSPHSPYTLSAEYLEEIIDYARRQRVPLAIHLAESAEEVDFLRESRGSIATDLFAFVGWSDMVPPAPRRDPVSYLAERNGLHSDCLLVHGVQVEQPDCEKIAAAGASVVLCPRSNARLGVGKAPVADYLAAGVNLALGTDSRASSETLSVWDEIAFARSWFAQQSSASDLIRMATAGGARALGISGEIGALEPRMGAHFQVLSPPRLPELQKLDEFLCSAGRTAEVSHLYLRNREVLQTA